jgi:hypothetical protein
VIIWQAKKVVKKNTYRTCCGAGKTRKNDALCPGGGLRFCPNAFRETGNNMGKPNVFLYAVAV